MERPLTHREQELLAQLATHEAGADPAFARRLRGDPPARSPGRPRAVRRLVAGVLAVLGLVVLALLLVPGVFVVAAVATAVLVVVPVALIAWALRQGDPPLPR